MGMKYPKHIYTMAEVYNQTDGRESERRWLEIVQTELNDAINMLTDFYTADSPDLTDDLGAVEDAILRAAVEYHAHDLVVVQTAEHCTRDRAAEFSPDENSYQPVSKEEAIQMIESGEFGEDEERVSDGVTTVLEQP